jgi:hypothetical protein
MGKDKKQDNKGKTPMALVQMEREHMENRDKRSDDIVKIT